MKIGKLFSELVSQVSCGAFHTAVVSSDGCLFTWGDGLCGKLGHGNHEPCTEPRQVLAFSTQKEFLNNITLIKDV